MNNLKQLLIKPLSKASTRAVILLLVVALLGFADATFLTVEHYQNKIPPCTTDGCETVLTSAYSIVAGVPVSLAGSIYYLIVLIGLFIYLDSKNLKVLRYTLLFTVAGLIASLWFLYLQAFVIHAFCQYCLGSAASSTLLFIIAFTMLSRNAKEPEIV